MQIAGLKWEQVGFNLEKSSSGNSLRQDFGNCIEKHLIMEKMLGQIRMPMALKLILRIRMIKSV